ncbi:hypothetical protein EMIHUDRAFT_221965 [Emiliania huxleyi CCMP1516]|uniref:EF-hand domain-containing protein n=2 Tax=Emiliania huxleyi TaxID=2903 RepID=A0A0D3HXQ2_EMIH1|nr:hypothetical protein EMIHUDRAFT_221965 [Emiliania huxleyi CCMP1516]EOD03787.1 hypothetical protein EMIHUDRAFT_221965 [Emiliania huxleyi CCMP1516]|eukprot:XP_005756216.1 hypothetical protein EMIHUDRAFT_221965 [Emiliania huxleyi CCMP1516]
MMLRVTRPSGSPVGSQVIVQDPSGRQFRARIPPGVAEGGVFHVRVPAAAPAMWDHAYATPAPRSSGGGGGQAAVPGGLPVAVPTPPGGSVPMGLPVTATPAQRQQPPPPPFSRETDEEREERELAQALAESARLAEPSNSSFGLRPRTGSDGVTRQLAECADLCAEPCAVFWDASSRRELPSKSCPLCRCDFDKAVVLPSLERQPEVWFRTCDVKGDGYLSKQEVINVLLSQFPLDVDRFEARMEDAWPQVDPNGDGDEFFAPETGLLALVRANLTDDMRVEPVEAAPPDVRTQRNAWFDHFDDDKTGSLTQEELTRALVKTYALGADLAQVRTMRDFVAAVFPAFTAEATISRDAFLRPGEGLADTIIAQLDHLSPRPSPSGV